MDNVVDLEELLNYIDEGVLVIDKHGNIITFNNKALDMKGIDKESLIGKNILDIFPSITEETSTIYKVLREEKSLINHYGNFTNKLNGYKGSFLASTIPLFENGKLECIVDIYKDITKLEEYTYESYQKSGAIYKIEDIIGNSASISSLRKKIYQISENDSSVLVYGETGVGKELVVHSIHNSSKRKNNTFIAQNCAALPKSLMESILFGTTEGSFTGAKNKMGLFELADNGTLFLDELNSLDVDLQAKLLRVIQEGVVRRIGDVKERKVNTRIITSMNIDPIKAIEENILRKDLYYRLNVIELFIPPLTERKEDITLLANFFINLYNKKFQKNIKSISNEISEIFTNYNWPGNLRELKYTIESIISFIQKDEITIKDIPERIIEEKNSIVDKNSYNEPVNLTFLSLTYKVEEFEKKIIKLALHKTNNNITKAAAILKLPKQTLHNKIKKYEIQISTNNYFEINEK